MSVHLFHDVSIIIPVIGDHPFIERCIRSCSAQSYPGRSYEILILSDGKSTSIDNVISNYGRGQNVSNHITNLDPVSILNTALKNSTGRFIVFLSPNDFLSDFMILVQTIFLYDNVNNGGVSVDYWIVDPSSDRKISRINALETPILEGIMFRKDIFVKLSQSEGQPLTYEPQALLEMLTRNTSIGHLPLSFYRKSAGLNNSAKTGA